MDSAFTDMSDAFRFIRQMACPDVGSLFDLSKKAASHAFCRGSFPHAARCAGLARGLPYSIAAKGNGSCQKVKKPSLFAAVSISALRMVSGWQLCYNKLHQ